MIRRPIEAVFDEELVEGVGGDTGLVFEYLGCSGRRGDAEDGSPVGSELGDGGSEGGGLAGAGGADDEDELLVTGHAGRGVGLGDVEVDVGSVDRCGFDVAAGVETTFGPVEEVVLLVEDGLRRQRPVDGRL